MRNVAILVGVLALAACGSERSGTSETDDGTADYTVDTADGDTSMTFTSEEGEVTIKGGAGQAVDMPAGFSVYPGSAIVNSSQVSHEDGSGVRIAMQTPDSAEKAIAYYRQQATAQGIAISSEITNNNTRMVAGEGSDGTTLSVTAVEGEGETTVTLMVAKGF